MTPGISGDSPNGNGGSTVPPSETGSKVKQIICPGCFEEMAKEELIGNKCPLCGYRLAPEDMDEVITETGDEELAWMLRQNLQRTLLSWLMDLGAAPPCGVPDCLKNLRTGKYSGKKRQNNGILLYCTGDTGGESRRETVQGLRQNIYRRRQKDRIRRSL